MSQNLSSAAVVIGALRVNCFVVCLTFSHKITLFYNLNKDFNQVLSPLKAGSLVGPGQNSFTDNG